jgi:hypothetical protein
MALAAKMISTSSCKTNDDAAGEKRWLSVLGPGLNYEKRPLVF